MDSRLFSRGFIAYPSDDQPDAPSPEWAHIREHWAKREIAGLNFFFHPLTKVSQARAIRRVSIIGDAFVLGRKRSVRTPAWRLAMARDVFAELNKLSGRFAVIIEDGDKTFAAHDAFGARTVYFLKDRQGVFGSHIHLLGKLYGLPEDSAYASFRQLEEFKARTVKYAPGFATAVESVRPLPPNHYLDLKTQKIKRYWPIAPKQAQTEDDAYEHYLDLSSSLAHFLKDRDTVMGITGGIDCRLSLNGLLKYGARPLGVTWPGRLGKLEEESVIRVAETAGITNLWLNQADPGAEVTNMASLNAGRARSPLVASMAKTFGSNPKSVFLFGYGGEIMRGFYGTPAKGCAANDAAKLYSSSSKAEFSDGYLRTVNAYFEEWLEETDTASAVALGYDLRDIMYWEHRMGTWGAAMLNENDPALYCLASLNSRSLYQSCFGIPDKKRLTKKFFQRLIARDSEALAKVPVR